MGGIDAQAAPAQTSLHGMVSSCSSHWSSHSLHQHAGHRVAVPGESEDLELQARAKKKCQHDGVHEASGTYLRQDQVHQKTILEHMQRLDLPFTVEADLQNCTAQLVAYHD